MRFSFLKNYKQEIPNFLTVLRGIFTIFIIPLFYFDFPHKFLWIFIFFSVASITDFFDGFFARKWGSISNFGIVFDSLLDKILTTSLFILLIPFSIFPLPLVLFLILRDIFVDGLKNYSLSLGIPVPSVKSGKIKFTFQVLMILGALLFLAFPSFFFLQRFAEVCGILAFGFSFFSAWEYGKRIFPLL